MTERESDPLYDALRDRLADYGQEPPAPLWASIRAQLPPPAAAPVLRTHRRRHWALLSLLLLLLSVGGWQWWQLAGRFAARGVARNEPTAAPGRAASAEPAAGRASAAPDNPAALDKSAVAAQNRSALPTRSETAASVAPAAAPVSSAPSIASAADPVVGASRVQPTDHYRAPLTDRSAARSAGRAAGSMANSTSRAHLVAAIATRPADGPGRRARGLLPPPLIQAAASPNSAASRATGGTAFANGRSIRPTTALDKARQTTAPGRASRVASVASAGRTGTAATPPEATAVAGAITPETLAASTAAAGRSARAAGGGQSGKPAATRPAGPAGGVTAAAGTAPILAGTTVARAAGIAIAAEAGQILARPAVLRLGQVWLRPEQLAPTDTLPHQPALAPARWAIQVLAGPALTYRYLGSTSQLSASGPSPIGVNYNPTTNSGLPTLERPALAGGGEVSIRRQLSGPWSISTGLGYVEYATRLALQLVRPASTSRLGPVSDSILGSIHRRDTYHVVTIPLRLGYSRALSGRWRVGVLAGAEAAVYVGGRTSEGSACACQSQSWGTGISPYRRLSLGLSLGMEARYRLNGRWELLAQPMGTYLLTPLNKLVTTNSERHLLGASALLGAAWNLP